ncbi:F-box SKP2A-like [Olea europaea subsp. europaea]|uniref:F-box SKP2A-like n=2 Tax=Olea europaea subsp. europaea TaxID=158383 RepID=A0A8S0R9V2_OLEEU|nr:F-box SKP2A-like [Olea europaea subsp. europaea]
MRETNTLGLCSENMLIFGGGAGGGGRPRISESNDIPVELLLRIISLVHDRTVVVASGVRHGWRDAISWGITHLSLSWCKKNMNNLVLSLVPNFTILQVLILRQDTPELQDNAVETIASYCHDLQELDLSKSFRLTDQSLYALAHGCLDLMNLNISGCSAFSDMALAYLSGFCRKLKILNLCGCVKAATDIALKAIGFNFNQLQSLNLGWCDHFGDDGVKSLAYGCPDLRALDLCGCLLITDESVIALANNCLHLKSLDLYYCQSITDRAMYSLAQSQLKNKHETWNSPKNMDEGLTNLNISQCTALTPPAVQALCDSFPALHTCPGRHSLIISGCLNLTSVHCACAVQAHRAAVVLPHLAH